MFNAQVLGHMHVVAEQIVTDLCTSKTNRYRVVIDSELNREQSVYHPQLHVMAGCDLQSLPG